MFGQRALVVFRFLVVMRLLRYLLVQVLVLFGDFPALGQFSFQQTIQLSLRYI